MTNLDACTSCGETRERLLRIEITPGGRPVPWCVFHYPYRPRVDGALDREIDLVDLGLDAGDPYVVEFHRIVHSAGSREAARTPFGPKHLVGYTTSDRARPIGTYRDRPLYLRRIWARDPDAERRARPPGSAVHTESVGAGRLSALFLPWHLAGRPEWTGPA